MSDSLLDDIKNLQESCFSIEDRLPRMFLGSGETLESRVRLELYNIRCKLGSITEFIKQHDVQYIR